MLNYKFIVVISFFRRIPAQTFGMRHSHPKSSLRVWTIDKSSRHLNKQMKSEIEINFSLFWSRKSAVTCCENGYTLNGKSPVCLAQFTWLKNSTTEKN